MNTDLPKPSVGGSSPLNMTSARLMWILPAVLLGVVTFEGIAQRYLNVEKSNDPVMGRVYREGHTVVARIEGFGRAHFIQGGVRRPAPLPPGSPPPLLALGDSFTEALQVTDDEVYTGRLERILRAEGVCFPILNLSSSGFSLPDYIEIAPAVLKRMGQTWTIIQVRDSDLTFDAWSPAKRHFVRQPGTQALAIESPNDVRVPAPWQDALYNSIALAPWTLLRLQAFRSGLRSAPPLFRAGRGPRGANPGDTVPPVDGDMCRREMEMLAEAYGGRLTLLWIAEFDPRHPSRRTPVEDLAEQSTRDLGMSFVNTRAAYGEFAARDASPFGFPNSRFNFGHMNPGGHAAAARLLAREIVRLHRNAIF